VQPTQEARLLAALDHERAWREMLQKKLATAEAARHEADEQLVLARAEVQRQRHASTRTSNICTVLQERTLELEAALQQAEQRRTSESAAAADRLTQRHGEFTASLADAARSRDALAQQLSGAMTALEALRQAREADKSVAAEHLRQREAAFAEAEVRHADERAAALEESREQRAMHDAAVARLAHREADLLEQLAHETDERAVLEQNLEAAARARSEAEEHHARELTAAAERLTEREADLAETRAEFARGRRRLLEAASALRRRTSEQKTRLEVHFAGELATRERRLIEREDELQQIQQDRDTLRQTLVAAREQLQELSATRDEERQEFERERSRSQLEIERLSGELHQARQSLDHLQSAFNTLEQLSSEHAIERARLEGVVADRDTQINTRESAYLAAEQAGKEAIQRLDAEIGTVRLELERVTKDAAALRTDVRAAEESLRQARRMEAVGRLASEVAINCETLLRDVSESAKEWLDATGSDPVVRDQGEQLVGDVNQATSLLQRLAAYSKEQVDALEPVDLKRVFRNLEPVMKRVAGDEIELVLPKSIPSLTVDVEKARVERVLVNVASHARERMPHGGRLKIDLASTVLDREFLDRFPNVRPGRHVVATVTEERSAAMPTGAKKAAGNQAGMDVSALGRLLGDCGGHLWVTAEPTGNMLLKIHLPLLASNEAVDPEPSLSRGSALARWFR